MERRFNNGWQSRKGFLFSDVFCGQPYIAATECSSKNGSKQYSTRDFDYDSVFKPLALVNEIEPINNGSSHSGPQNFDDLLNLQSTVNLGEIENKSVSVSSHRTPRGFDDLLGTPQSATSRERNKNNIFRYSESNIERTIPVGNFLGSHSFLVPRVIARNAKSLGQSGPGLYNGTSSQLDKSSRSGQDQQSDDVWLTVLDIPLRTQVTTAPPPSRTPPTIPSQASRSRNIVDESLNLHVSGRSHTFPPAAAGVKEKEARDRTAAMRAGAGYRHQAERAAVERDASE
ncbi:auxilin-related protein 1-like [Dorcoceras hygrometricum]|uniref:Auxilin-related protein 1-like n=1 Tax=Dorcoceras hygrometricum TaxID=472368 RepID=A0A2Z7D4X4_9LAMI|nr:auxilin-related protein 1-like [Dorcoceras hygrometricum]